MALSNNNSNRFLIRNYKFDKCYRMCQVGKNCLIDEILHPQKILGKQQRCVEYKYEGS